jgi:cytosine/adenosine deaminase-related metal-dependent hydrolase
MKLLSAAYVLPIKSAAIPDGAVVVDEGRILAVGKKAALADQYPRASRRSSRTPSSCRARQRAHASRSPKLRRQERERPAVEFFDWLLLSWQHRKKLTPAARRQCIDDGIRQLLRAGTTCVGDTGQYVGVIAQAANAPVRMVLFPEMVSGGDEAALDGFEGAFSQVDEILDSKSTRLSAASLRTRPTRCRGIF